MLMRKNWRDHLYRAREQMPKAQDGDMPMPLAEVILQAQSSQVLEAINHVHQLARAGQLRSAMEEAFHALTYAPTYLPLHTLMGDLLVRENHTEEAIAKFNTTAQAYSVRGEAAQAAKLLRRVIQLAPMDMGARKKLIDQLVSRGQVDDAIREYLELADTSLPSRRTRYGAQDLYHRAARGAASQRRPQMEHPHPPAHGRYRHAEIGLETGHPRL